MTTILSIQSHVAYGHVGNSASVFPMQRLGVEVWPVHTVNFSNHTEYPDWGGPGTVLNIGINAACHQHLAETRGQEAADAIYRGFVQSYAIHVARLDPDMFSDPAASLAEVLDAYQDETAEEFPQDPALQLAEVLRSMARAWDGPTARLLRQAKGAPADAALGLVVQDMALALGPGVTGSGTIQFIDSVTGTPRITGRFRGQTQGRAIGRDAESIFLTRDPRGPSLEEAAPAVFADLVRFGAAARQRLRDARVRRRARRPDCPAARLIGDDVLEVTEDGSPRGALTFALWQPPEDDEGSRRSPTTEAADLMAHLVGRDVQTLAFARSRAGVEALATSAARQVSAADDDSPAPTGTSLSSSRSTPLRKPPSRFRHTLVVGGGGVPRTPLMRAM
mgnify:CR=1 FL=1